MGKKNKRHVPILASYKNIRSCLSGEKERERGGLVPSFREITCVLNIIIMVRYALGNFLRNIFFKKILVIGVANDQHNGFNFFIFFYF